MGAARRSLGNALAPGTVLGRYELVQAVAIGGMAEIYLARSQGPQRFEKYVILKRILPHLAVDDRFVEMFLEEARLAATMSHSNVVQVLDFGESAGSFYFTMEYVHGEDARTILKACRKRERRLDIADAITIVSNAAAGLHYAHELVDDHGQPLGVVHRDVSPSNIMVTFDGTVKVADFGIAKATQRSSATNTGTIKGKVSYMSPEQCQGEALDRRSDVFSLGIVLYELTTGLKLFGGENDLAIMRRIIEKDVAPPSTLVPDYPPALDRIVSRALQRARDDRHASALELQTDLEQFCRSAGHVTSAPELANAMQGMFGKRQHPWIGQRQPSVIAMESSAIDWDAESRPTTLAPTPTASPRAGARPHAPSRRPPRAFLLLAGVCALALAGAIVFKTQMRDADPDPEAAIPATGSAATPGSPPVATPPSAPPSPLPAATTEPAAQTNAAAASVPTVPTPPTVPTVPTPPTVPTVPTPPTVPNVESTQTEKPAPRPPAKAKRPARPVVPRVHKPKRDLDSPFLPK